MARRGMRITFSGLGGGLTVDAKGKHLLPHAFVLQCPPMEEFRLVRAFSSQNYDTIGDGEFTRQGGRRLITWTFDTIAMILASSSDGRHTYPSWVSHPSFSGSSRKPEPPEWYLKQIIAVHDSGAPFRFTAEMPGEVSGGYNQTASSFSSVISTPAILLGFEESHKAGEGDAIYFTNMQFSEWRDPRTSRRGLGSGQHLPTSVELLEDGTCRTVDHKIIKGTSKKGCSAADLAKHFYHHPHDWRAIFKANHLSGGSGHTALIKLPKYVKLKKHKHHGNVVAKVKIPKLEPKYRDVPKSPLGGDYHVHHHADA